MISYVAQFIAAAEDPKAVKHPEPERQRAIVGLMKAAQHFKLPQDGTLIDDPEMKGLDRNIDIHLPFPYITLEFDSNVSEGPCKFIITAGELDNGIIIHAAINVYGRWLDLYNNVKIEKRVVEKDGETGWLITGKDDDTTERYTLIVYILLSFLNALACSNVTVERSTETVRSKDRIAGIEKNGYHVLVLRTGNRTVAQGDGSSSHASPREHLRRGHIRRLQTGKTLWINSMVINAGKGLGRVEKTYNVKASIPTA